MRIDGKYKWLFVANGKKGPVYSNMHSPENPDVPNPVTSRFRIRGEYTPVLYDTVRGEIKRIPYTVKDGDTFFELKAFRHDSFLFRLEPAREHSYRGESSAPTVLGRTDIKTLVNYERDEQNVLLLDLAEWKFDDETEYRPLEEMRRLDGLMRAAAGIPRKSGKQPWCLAEEKATHRSIRRFTFTTETELVGAEFATEDMDDAEILLDGVKLAKNKTGYFTDKSIEKIALPTVAVGTHTVEIILPLAPRTYNENCFLLGNFNVRLEGTTATVVAPTEKIGFGSVTAQGMPFYGANLTYSFEVDAPEGTDTMKIASTLWRGAVIGVKVDGRDCGKIAFQPYELTVDGVFAGKHTVEMTLFGTRHNCFGALHNCNRSHSWYGPAAWTAGGAAFAYEYNLREMGIIRSPEITFIKK
jgi:hypothetical protein